MTKNFFNWRSNLLSGLFVVLPIFISLAIAWWIFDLLTSGVSNYFSNTFFAEYKGHVVFKFALRIISLVIALILIYIVGLFTRNYVGKRVITYWENVISRIPIVSIVHGTIRQIMDTVLSRKAHMFSKVALVEYPRKDVFVVGFITGRGSAEINEITKQPEMVTVFIPTTPNPTSGFLIFVPEFDVKVLNMTVTEGMQLVISGGSVKPEDLKKKVSQKI